MAAVDFLGGPIPCVALEETQNPDNLYLWYGQGPFVRRRRLTQGNDQDTKLAVFSDENVHGICLCAPQRAWVWGGRRLVLVQSRTDILTNVWRLETVPLDTSDDEEPRPSSFCLPDWIWEVAVLETTQQSTFTLAVGLAHNIVQLFHGQYSESNQGVTRIRPGRLFTCSTRCLLYCLAIHPATRQVAAGSVTQGILLWDLLDTAHTTAAPVTSQLSDHKGVIHGLSFSKSGLLLASASDDRTVRLWRQQDDKTTTWKLHWSAYGHTARCWKVTFVHDDTRVVSTAEDGTTRVWNVASGACVKVWRGHASPNVWSLTSNGDWLVTGGGNGTVAVFPWRSVAQTSSTDTATRLTVTVPDDRTPPPISCDGAKPSLNTDNKRRGKTKGKTVQQTIMGTQFYTNHNDKCLLAATRSGTLISLHIRSGTWKQHRDWCPPTNIGTKIGIQACDGICFAMHVSLSLIAIGLKTGALLLTRFEENKTESNTDYSVLSSGGDLRGVNRVVWVTSNLLACFHAQTLRIWKLSDVSQRLSNLTESAVCWSFATGLRAVVTCVAFDEKNDYIAAGDNRGHVCTFSLLASRDLHKDDTIPPISIRRLHGRENVNDIYFVNQDTLISVGNDGRVCQSFICKDGIILSGVSIPLLSLSGITRIFPLPRSPIAKILVAGYLSNTLSVADPECSYEFLSLDTGGRSRGSTLYVDSHNRIAVAICSNRKDGLNDILVDEQDIVEQFSGHHLKWSYGIPLHHETIFDSCAVRLLDDRAMFVTGSEDCSSRLSIWSDSTGSFISSQPLTPQESGVRAVCASLFPGGSSSLIVVGGSKLGLQFFRVDHRIYNANREVKVELLSAGALSTEATIDIDHRINALASFQGTSEGQDMHVIASGDSNGRIFFYMVAEPAGRPTKGILIHESERPVLSLDFFTLQSEVWLAFGTSGGIVGILHINLQPEPQAKLLAYYEAHAVGTNSVSTRVVKQGLEEAVLILSGGDDQRLTVRQVVAGVTDDGSNVLSLCEPLYKDLASASAIRSAKWLDSDSIAAVGYSGELIIWNYKEGVVSLFETRHATVGDINGMAVVARRSNGSRAFLIGVVGYGLQLFEVDL